MNKRARLTLTFMLLGTGACSTSTPIGVEDLAGASGQTMLGASGSSGTAGAGGASGAPAQGPYVPSGVQAIVDQPFTNPSGVSGDWVGYLESYDMWFTSSDALTLHFGVDAAGNGTLSVVQGMGTVPPPPTDPFQAWPLPLIDAEGGPGPGEAYPHEPLAGFAYSAHEVTWQGSRLQFQTYSSEPWAAWCGLQTSYPWIGDMWSCNAGSSATYPTPTTCKFTEAPNARCTPNHLDMCLITSGFCACNSTGCGFSKSGGGSLFDITFMGDHALGTMDSYSLMLMPASP
jgi:hypothetical protein